MSGGDSENSRLNRRTVLKTGAGATMAGIGWMIAGTDQTTARATLENLTASDVSVSSGDGELSSLTIDPDLTINWNSFPSPVNTLNISLYAEVGGTNNILLGNDFTNFNASVSGSFSPDIAEISLLRKNSGDFSADEFDDPTEGNGPEETEVTLIVSVIFLDANDNAMTVNGEKSLTESIKYTVSVRNEEASATVSGSFNTSGS